MDIFSKRRNRHKIVILQVIIVGILINILLSYLSYELDLPVFWDTIGTIGVAALTGVFPGMFVAILTNIICSIFNEYAPYFGIVNVMIAVITVWFMKKGLFKSLKNSVLYVATIGAGSGLLSAVIQCLIIGSPQNDSIRAILDSADIKSGVINFIAFSILNIMFNIFDKGICFGVIAILMHFMPENAKIRLSNSSWMQRPLSQKEEEDIGAWSANTHHSSKKRMALVVTIIAIAATIVTAYTALNQYFDAAKEEKIHISQNAASFAASVVDANKIDEYIRDGENAPGYKETEEILYRIRDNASGVYYLYVVKVDNDNITYVFDLDADTVKKSYALSDDTKGEAPGTVIPLSNEFEEYKDDILAGREIPSIESKSAFNWVVSSYYPVYDSSGKVVCYAGADASLDYLENYMDGFGRRLILILAGIIAVIVAYGIWISNYYTVYPIESIGVHIRKITEAGDNQEELDEVVRQIRKIDIRTNDEIERLYNDLCDMALNQTEKIRSIRRLSEDTAQMQDGLIITMADLVENRDSDTGAHIQKTAAYVKIIVEGLLKKGYYAEKITPKFASDVVRSAPLHDVGKINIPDNVLNKPGKLTDEEFEIMKSHTTAGMHIMEKAINTVGGENYLKEARNMAAYHHERWDGKGYPEGLHGEVIPLSARIMAVADVFDALTSPRVYKPAFPLDKALSIIEEGKGVQFDPKCVEVFMEALPEVKAVLKKYNKDAE